MKLRITVEDRAYVVDVELLNEQAAGATLHAGVDAAQPLSPEVHSWHDLGAGPHGEACAPIPGIIAEIGVRIGDVVKANDPLLTLEAARVFSTGDHPLRGTLRALHAGTVSEVLVQPGDVVRSGQALVRFGSVA